jgi:hypothetical protein
VPGSRRHAADANLAVDLDESGFDGDAEQLGQIDGLPALRSIPVRLKLVQY